VINKTASLAYHEYVLIEEILRETGFAEKQSKKVAAEAEAAE